eukprot:Pgem_evm1s8280
MATVLVTCFDCRLVFNENDIPNQSICTAKVLAKKLNDLSLSDTVFSYANFNSVHDEYYGLNDSPKTAPSTPTPSPLPSISSASSMALPAMDTPTLNTKKCSVLENKLQSSSSMSTQSTSSQPQVKKVTSNGKKHPPKIVTTSAAIKKSSTSATGGTPKTRISFPDNIFAFGEL